MLSRSLTAAVAVAFLAGIAPMSPVGAASSVCDRFSQGEREGHIQDVTLDEVSGIVASRRHPGVLWAHNDSGHGPCRAPQRDEPQGEAVAFASDGSAYFTIGEGIAAPVYRFPVIPALDGGR